ncbi:MAG: hypothetical protein AB1758_03760 [Candidatus Eremiobacterota bacterium]
MRWVTLALLMVLGCSAPGPDTFATVYVEGDSVTTSPATLSEKGLVELTAPGLKLTGEADKIQGEIRLQDSTLPVKSGRLTVQNRTGGLAQGNFEIVVEGKGELRGSFKATLIGRD